MYQKFPQKKRYADKKAQKRHGSNDNNPIPEKSAHLEFCPDQTLSGQDEDDYRDDNLPAVFIVVLNKLKNVGL